VNQLVEKYSDVIVGHLTGFDRLVMRGSLRNLAVPPLFESFLAHSRVLLKTSPETSSASPSSSNEPRSTTRSRPAAPSSICPPHRSPRRTWPWALLATTTSPEG